MSMMFEAAQWLSDKIAEHATTTVTYSRSALSVTLAAAVGRTAYRIADDYGSRLEYGDRDYLVQASNLVLGGTQTTPEPGDQVTESDGSVYEVLAMFGEPCWRYSDPHHQTLRIHTKKVA